MLSPPFQLRSVDPKMVWGCLRFEYFDRLCGSYQHVISLQVNPSAMTVRLRLAIHGVRHNRIFHLVAIDQRKRRNAKPIELLGVYRQRVEPNSPHKSVEWSVDRIKYWLGVGAQPSDSVVKLLTTVRPQYTRIWCCVRLRLKLDWGNREKLYHRVRSGIPSLHFKYNTNKPHPHHPHNHDHGFNRLLLLHALPNRRLPPLLSVFQYLYNLVVTTRFRKFKGCQVVRVLHRVSLSAYTRIAHEWVTRLKCPVHTML